MTLLACSIGILLPFHIVRACRSDFNYMHLTGSVYSASTSHALNKQYVLNNRMCLITRVYGMDYDVSSSAQQYTSNTVYRDKLT